MSGLRMDGADAVDGVCSCPLHRCVGNCMGWAEPKPLADALAHVRATSPINKERDAGPELTPVKDALRAWVEPQLASLRPFVPAGEGASLPSHGEGALAAKINAALQANGLTCDGGSPAKPHWSPKSEISTPSRLSRRCGPIVSGRQSLSARGDDSWNQVRERPVCLHL